MSFDALKQNLERIKEIVREMYVFSNQLKILKDLNKKSPIDVRERKLLMDIMDSQANQLRILNNSIPHLLEGIGYYPKLKGDASVTIATPTKKLVQIEYKPSKEEEKVSITVSEDDRRIFLENLSRSNLSINQLKKKYSSEKPAEYFGKANPYAKISNKFFRETSNKFLSEGKLNRLNIDLRRMNSPFVVTTYVSMILFTIVLSFIFSFLLIIFLTFYNISLSGSFITPVSGSLLFRLLKISWLIIGIPVLTALGMYYYPKSEGKSIGSRINQELPFVTIHMAAIANSGIRPSEVFRIIVKNQDYKHTRIQIKKLLNLINLQGYDLATALKKVAHTCPSNKLGELFDGIANNILTGGSLHTYLDEHAKSLLFTYKLEREKYTRTAETMMDIYISVAIAAPMILLMLFVIMGSTGMNFLGISTSLMSVLIILAIIFINVFFLIFLKIKQPAF